MAYFEKLPEEILALQQELRNWPMITAEAQQCKTIEETLGTIAARLGIVMDGLYDIPQVCDMLVKKLREMRTSNIVMPSKEFVDIQIKVNDNEITLENVPNPALPSSKPEST